MKIISDQQYLELQAKYLEARDNRVLSEMYLMCAEMGKRYIKKYARQRHLRLDVETFSHEAASYVICRYLDNPEFSLYKMSTYIFLCCNTAMARGGNWYKRTVSFEDWMAGGE